MLYFNSLGNIEKNTFVLINICIIYIYIHIYYPLFKLMIIMKRTT